MSLEVLAPMNLLAHVATTLFMTGLIWIVAWMLFAVCHP